MAKKAGGAERESLAKELKELIPKLDSEGLAFLVEQAKIHLYNMRVDDLNKAAETSGLSKGKEAAAQKNGNLRIEGSESGSSYYLYVGTGDAMFSRDEMAHLVKMVCAGGTDLEIRERLFNWLERERADVFSVLPAADKFDPRLKALAAFIKKNFKLRGR